MNYISLLPDQARFEMFAEHWRNVAFRIFRDSYTVESRSGFQSQESKSGLNAKRRQRKARAEFVLKDEVCCTAVNDGKHTLLDTGS